MVMFFSVETVKRICSIAQSLCRCVYLAITNKIAIEVYVWIYYSMSFEKVSLQIYLRQIHIGLMIVKENKLGCITHSFKQNIIIKYVFAGLQYISVVARLGKLSKTLGRKYILLNSWHLAPLCMNYYGGL